MVTATSTGRIVFQVILNLTYHNHQMEISVLDHFAVLCDLRIFAEYLCEVDPYVFIFRLTILLLCVLTHPWNSGLHQKSIISNSTMLFSCLQDLLDPSFYFYSSKIDTISFATYFISGLIHRIQNTVNNVYIINSNVYIINYSNANYNPCAH